MENDSLLKKYNNIINEIFRHVGLEKRLSKYSIIDRTDFYWLLEKDVITGYKYFKNETEDLSHSIKLKEQLINIKYDKELLCRGEELTIALLYLQNGAEIIYAIYNNANEIRSDKQ